MILPRPSEVVPLGLLGERLRRCREALLLAKDESALLAGFVQRPGAHPWIGEHVGKWLDAACGEWQRTRDDRLAAKIARVVTRLRQAQESDGYLGTYLRAQRWTEWDVWVHKYVLIGLLAHWEAFGDELSLDAARRIGDLLRRTFQPTSERSLQRTRQDFPLDLVSATVSSHAGMAAGSVLVGLCRLARATGEARDLDLARFVADRLDAPGGPGIAATLRAGRGVHEVANGKAYELLSCLTGLVDLAELAGDAGLAEPARLAFDDIVARHLYVTGGLSHGEYFRTPGSYSQEGEVAETCALVTWMQLCVALFRFHGDRRYLEPFERAAWNHLLAAQKEDGSAFCYFTPLAGPREYRTDLNCCGSSGPRGLSLVPQLVVVEKTVAPAAGASAGEPPRDEIHVPLLMEVRFARPPSPAGADAGSAASVEVLTDFSDALRARNAAPGTVGHVQITAFVGRPTRLVLHVPTWSTAADLATPLGPPVPASAGETVAVDLAAGARWRGVLTLPFRAEEIHRRAADGREFVATLDGPFVLARADAPGSIGGAAPAPFFEYRDPARPPRVWRSFERGAAHD